MGGPSFCEALFIYRFETVGAPSLRSLQEPALSLPKRWARFRRHHGQLGRALDRTDHCDLHAIIVFHNPPHKYPYLCDVQPCLSLKISPL